MQSVNYNSPHKKLDLIPSWTSLSDNCFAVPLSYTTNAFPTPNARFPVAMIQSNRSLEVLPTRSPNRSSKPTTTTTLTHSSCLAKTLIRHRLAPTLRRLIHRRRHIGIVIRGRRRRVSFHTIAWAVVLTVRRRTGVVRPCVPRLRCIAHLSAPEHPGMVCERLLAIAQPALGMVVAADEEGEEGQEEESYDGVARRHASLSLY